MKKTLSLLLLLSVALPASAEDVKADMLNELSGASKPESKPTDKPEDNQDSSNTESDASKPQEPVVSRIASARAWIARYMPVTKEEKSEVVDDSVVQRKLALDTFFANSDVASTQESSVKDMAYRVLKTVCLSTPKSELDVLNALKQATSENRDLIAKVDHENYITALKNLADSASGVPSEWQTTLSRVRNVLSDNGNAIITPEGNVASRFVADRPGTSAAVVAVAGTAAWLVVRSAKNAATATAEATAIAAVNSAKDAALAAAGNGLQNEALVAAQKAATTAFDVLLVAITK